MKIYREARIEDKENIAALMIQVWLHTYAIDGLRDGISNYVLSEFIPEKIGADIESKGNRYFVCEVKDHIVGVAVINTKGMCPSTKKHSPELDKLYVQEHFYRKGIGFW